MKRNKIAPIKNFAILILLLASSFLAFSQGLRFVGLEQDIEKRTSFDVFNGKSKIFKGELCMDFQVYMYPERDGRFGYLFRIIEDGSEKRIWNLSYNAEVNSDKVVMRFSEEGDRSLIIAEIGREDFPELKWVNISLDIKFKDNVVKLTIDGKEFEGAFSGDKSMLKADIIFGVNDYIIDVPSFALRNLSINDNSWSVSFPFNESKGENVHNSSRKVVGHVTNPQWMVRESLQWSHICSLSLDSHAGYGYDENAHRFYYFDKDSVYFFSAAENIVEKHACLNECPMNIGSGDNFLKEGKIVAYEPCGHFHSKRTSIATLDLETLQWEAITYNGIGKQAFHHTGFFNPVDSSYCMFGGYGNMMYNGEFFSISRNEPTWQRRWENCTDLHPRYFVASGTSGEKAYFFGGMGNSSGEQVVGRKYFYDFHCLDMRTGQMDLLWTLPQPEDNYVPVPKMVIDGEYAYVLCYPEYKSDSELSLHRMRLSDGDDTVLGSTVYICSDRLLTNAMLYLDQDMEKLYAVTQISKDDVSSKLDIYQINWPVMFDNDTYEDLRKGRVIRSSTVLLILLASVLIGHVFLYGRRRRKLEKSYVQAIARKEKKKLAPEDLIPNTIRLFGEFQVIDANGNNISNQINGQQRDILLLIAKYSTKEGISSERLSKIIWPDKEEDKVKNSRGVAINKLRASLSGVDGLSIVYENGSYKLVLDDITKCDFFEFYALTHENEPNIERILSITSRGKFISFSENEIFDTWKSSVEDKTVSILHEEARKRTLEKDWGTVMEIVDVLFSIDPLDEQALHFAIHCLKTLRHTEEARIRYADFKTEYRAVNGEEYNVPFIRL